MTLFDYVCLYVDLDATIRLWTNHKHGYGLISKYDLTKEDNIDDTCTVREFFAKDHWLSNYSEFKVVGCNDHAVPKTYHDALNILVEVPENFTLL